MSAPRETPDEDEVSVLGEQPPLDYLAPPWRVQYGDARAAGKEVLLPDWAGGSVGELCALCGLPGADVVEGGYPLHLWAGDAVFRVPVRGELVALEVCWDLWVRYGYRTAAATGLVRGLPQQG